MSLKIEHMDWVIWIAIIVPVIVILGFWAGWDKSAFLILALPFLVLLKNVYLEHRLSWKPSYSVGVSRFDSEHRRLLELMWLLFKSLGKSSGSEDAAKIMDELEQYTITHFTGEEELMAEHGYPGLENHRREHDVMKQRIGEFREKFDSDSVETSREVLRYLQDWLINHINVTDKAYQEFFNARSVR